MSGDVFAPEQIDTRRRDIPRGDQLPHWWANDRPVKERVRGCCDLAVDDDALVLLGLA
jgi:hypothetical protein